MADRTAYFAEYRKRPEALASQRKFQLKWRKANPDRAKQIKAKYRKDSGGLAVENKYATAKRKRERKELADPYLKYMLKRSMEGIVNNIPPELIEIYREQLLTKRLLKIKKHGSNNINQLLAGYAKSTQRKPVRAANGKKKAADRKRSK